MPSRIPPIRASSTERRVTTDVRPCRHTPASKLPVPGDRLPTPLRLHGEVPWHAGWRHRSVALAGSMRVGQTPRGDDPPPAKRGHPRPGADKRVLLSQVQRLRTGGQWEKAGIHHPPATNGAPGPAVPRWLWPTGRLDGACIAWAHPARAKCLRHKGKMGIMRGSLRPAHPGFASGSAIPARPGSGTYYPYRAMPAPPGAIIGAAVSLAKGDKINHRGA